MKADNWKEFILFIFPDLVHKVVTFWLSPHLLYS